MAGGCWIEFRQDATMARQAERRDWQAAAEERGRQLQAQADSLARDAAAERHWEAEDRAQADEARRAGGIELAVEYEREADKSAACAEKLESVVARTRQHVAIRTGPRRGV